jgi:heptaprenyl diphosphate synthase
MRLRKLTTMALLCAISLTIFLLEAQIPPIVPLPGVKIGLANIVTVFAVFVLGGREGAMILFCRIFLGAVFGSFSTIFYSAGGGILAILVTILMKKILTKKQIWVASVCGAIAHSVGQMAVAVVFAGTPSILIYLPALVGISVVTGIFTGLCAQFLVNRGNLPWKTTSN